MICNKLNRQNNSRGIWIFIILLLTFFLPSAGCSQQVVNGSGTPAVEPLISTQKNEPGRSEVTLVQGEEKAAQAVETLIAELKDEDENVRSEAALELGNLQDIRAVDPLIAALKDVSPDVRMYSAMALGKIKDTRAVEPLIASLKDGDSRVQTDAIAALVEIRDGRAVEPLIAALKDDDFQTQYSAIEALVAMKDARAIEALIGIMVDKDGYEQGHPINALVEIGEPAVDPLIAALKNDDPGIRTGAAQALGQIMDARAVEPLIAALKDDDSDVRDFSAQALGQLKDARAVEPLITALKDQEEELWVGEEAIKTLVEIGEPAVAPLIAALKNDAPGTQKYKYRAFLPLHYAIYKQSPDFSTMQEREINLYRRALNTWQSPLGQEIDLIAMKTLVMIGSPAVGPLIVAMKHEDPIIREKAAAVLVEINDARADDALNNALKNEDLGIITGAYNYYIGRGEKGSETILINALHKNGFQQMATDFLNSGNRQLKEAASEWGHTNGYIITQGTEKFNPTWGSSQ